MGGCSSSRCCQTARHIWYMAAVLSHVGCVSSYRGGNQQVPRSGKGKAGVGSSAVFPGCRPGHGEGPLGKGWQNVGSKPVLFLLQQAFSPFLHDMKELLYLDVLYKAVYHFWRAIRFTTQLCKMRQKANKQAPASGSGADAHVAMATECSAWAASSHFSALIPCCHLLFWLACCFFWGRLFWFLSVL